MEVCGEVYHTLIRQSVRLVGFSVDFEVGRLFLFSPVAMAPQYEMAVGLKKGHKVTKLSQKPRPSRRRGVRCGRNKCFRGRCCRAVNLYRPLSLRELGGVWARRVVTFV